MQNDETLITILRNVFPHLTPIRNEGQRGSAWQALPNVRKQLSTHFPGTRFSVKTEKPQEMSIKVKWTQWGEHSPTQEHVEMVLNPFKFWGEGPITGAPVEIPHRKWRDLFGETFGGVHSIDFEPTAPTPEQKARKSKAGLTKVVKGTRTSVASSSKPKM